MTEKEINRKVVQGKRPSKPETDPFWLEFGKNTVRETLSNLEERAKFMVTTIAALVVGYSGFLTFTEKFSLVTSFPPLLLTISITFFIISYFPIAKKFSMKAPDEIKDTYYSWLKWKLYWQYGGYALFIAGLIAILFINLISN